MRTTITLALVSSVALACGGCSDGAESPDKTTTDSTSSSRQVERESNMTEPITPTGSAQIGDASDAAAPEILRGLTMNRLDGTPEDLASMYAGKTVLVVNTASKCGLTPQYAKLEELYRSRSDKGFVVLGFPANDFMGQEPLSNDEIATFCSEEYPVSFPMFEKTTVKGDGVNELFARLTKETGEPSWNFTKYLITPDGTVTRFDPRTSPDDQTIVDAVDASLDAG